MTIESTETRLQKWWRAFSSQPHQLFFTLGFLQAVYSIFVVSLASAGAFDINIQLFHVVNTLYFMPISFFSGFLLTVLYRFLLQVPFVKNEYMPVFIMLCVSFLLANLGLVFNDFVYTLAMLVSVVAISKTVLLFIKTYQKSTIADKFDPFWIITLFASSIISAMLFIYTVFYPNQLTIAVNFTFYVFCIGTIFFVAQKMLPAFYGFFYQSTPIDRLKIPTLIILGCLLLIAMARIYNISWLLVGANILGGLMTTWLFTKNGVLFRMPKPILFILQVGIIWFIVGFLIGALEPLFGYSYLLQFHIFAVGFLGVMLIGFGSRVTLGHSDQAIVADSITVAIFVLFNVVVLLRLYAVFDASFVAISGFAWCGVIAIWLWRYLPSILRL